MWSHCLLEYQKLSSREAISLGFNHKITPTKLELQFPLTLSETTSMSQQHHLHGYFYKACSSLISSHLTVQNNTRYFFLIPHGQIDSFNKQVGLFLLLSCSINSYCKPSHLILVGEMIPIAQLQYCQIISSNKALNSTFIPPWHKLNLLSNYPVEL